MAENGSVFTWTKGRADAAVLVAEDELSDIAIAKKIGIGERTLYNWKEHPDFQARVQEHVATLEASVLKFAVAKKRYRMSVYDDEERRIRDLVTARADEHQDVPGGGTGLLVRQIKQIGAGRDATVIEEYTADTALLSERRRNLQQAAQEAGQWAEKREVTGKNGGPIEVDDASLTDEERVRRLRALLAISGETG